MVAGSSLLEDMFNHYDSATRNKTSRDDASAVPRPKRLSGTRVATENTTRDASDTGQT